MWSQRQKHCLNHMGIPLWQTHQNQAVPPPKAIKESPTSAETPANQPTLCLVLQSETPTEMMSGQQLIEDILLYLGKTMEDVIWFHGDLSTFTPPECPILPQNDKLAEQLKALHLHPLPSMTQLLSHPDHKKALWQQLKTLSSNPCA